MPQPNELTPTPEVALAKKENRYDFIDSIRGLAALFVVYLHSAGFFVSDYRPIETDIFQFFRNYIDPGKVGVVMFFIVSGLVIPFSLLHPGPHPLRAFIVNRFFRLYPIYWLSIAIGLVVLWPLDGVHATYIMVIANLTMLQQFIGIANVVDVYWTLQIELIFYALCAAMFMRKMLDKPKSLEFTAFGLLACAFLLAVFRFLLEKKLPVALPLGLSLMFWGTLWRQYMFKGNEECKRRAVRFMVAFVLCAPLLTILGYNKDFGFHETWYRYTLSYYSAIIIMFLLLGRFRITAPFFVWIGRASYSVYLFHPVVITLYLSQRTEWMKALPQHLQILFIMIVSVLISDLLFRIIEKPMINMGKIVNNRWDKKVLGWQGKLPH